MKIDCHCGATIFDHGAYKAHVIPDRNWDALLEAIDDAIEGAGLATAEARCMAVRQTISTVVSSVWQCRSCGRLYFQDEGPKLRCWTPENPERGTRLFDERET